MISRIALLLALAFAAGAARADCDRDSDCKGGRVCVANKCVERKYCMKDKDCPGDQVCDRNSCIAPSGAAPSSPGGHGGSSSGYGGSSREQEAARGAGMALLYTKNTWPISIADRPLMVAPGMTEIQLNVDRDFSAEPAGATTSSHPITSELFARFGLSDRIHAVLDSVGVCLTDCGNAGFFQFISGYLGYALVANHDMNLVTQFGFGVYNVLDKQGTGTETAILASALPSVLFGWRIANGVQIFSYAVASLGFVGRDHALFPDVLGLHVEPRIQLMERLTLAPFIGYTARFAHPEFYNVPLGAGLYFTPDRAVDVGLVFQFLDAFSHNVAPAGSPEVDTGGLDGRSATVFLTFRL